MLIKNNLNIMRNVNKEIIVSVSIFLFIFIIHLYSDVTTSFDSRWSIHTTMSMIKEGNTDLNEYEKLLRDNDYYMIEKINSKYYTIFPLGVSVIAVPFVYTLDLFLKKVLSISLKSYLEENIPKGIETLIASFIIALTAVILYIICREYLKKRESLIICFIFAFCTSSWSTASRALWQHGPSMLMLSTALLMIIKSKKNYKIIQYVGIPLAMSYVIRPTNSISILLLSIYILIVHRKYFIKYILWSLIVVIPFIIFNYHVYNFILPPYYLPSKLGNLQFLEALAGNLISPARGIFVYSPVLILSIWGMTIKTKEKNIKLLKITLISIIVMHWVAISQYPHWWGGYSFGPRIMSDIIPYLILFFIPLFVHMSTKGISMKYALAIIVFILAILSFSIHYRGANASDVYTWNYHPVNIDEMPSRLWDWSDPQFARGIKFLHR